MDRSEFLAAILDTVGALIVVLDREGRIVEFNKACEATTGYTEDELRGRPLWDILLLPDEVAEVSAVFDKLRAGMFPNSFENYWRTRDGERRRIAWSNTAILDSTGAVEYVIGTGLDVTGEREARDRARSVEKLAAVATMTAGIVHEIKNPLNGAVLLLTVLDRKLSAATPDVAAAREAAHRVSDELQRLARLLQGLLQFARPRAPLRNVADLYSIAESVVAYSEPTAQIALVTLELHGAPVIADVDADQIRQVLMNLMTNAIHASPQRGLVTVGVTKTDTHAVITVEDRGPGIPGSIETLFEPFFTTKSEGSGLGLAIVRRIVDDHGGEIRVGSRPGRTVFSVLLPITSQQ